MISRRGPPLVVKSAEHTKYPKGIAVYNFEVEDDHTYFVGEAQGGTWVHNSCDYSKLTNGELNALIGSEQRNLLKEFFGQGLKGVQNRAGNFQVPGGMSRETLEIYREVANRAIAGGSDSTGVQAARNELIRRALEAMK